MVQRKSDLEPLDVWVVCAPKAWGGHPFAVAWTEEQADQYIEQYYDDSTIAESRQVDIDVFGFDPGPAQKFRVSAPSITSLLWEVPIDVKRDYFEGTQGPTV